MKSIEKYNRYNYPLAKNKYETPTAAQVLLPPSLVGKCCQVVALWLCTLWLCNVRHYKDLKQAAVAICCRLYGNMKRRCHSTSLKYVPTIGAGKTCANRYQWIVCLSCFFFFEWKRSFTDYKRKYLFISSPKEDLL
jgi:hypothetical protein